MMMETMQKEMRDHLTQDIIPFWKGLRDDESGGYYGMLTFDLKLDKKAVKGCILNSRILWFFSNAYMLLKDETLLSEADHAYEFLKKHCLDEENGGVFWSCRYDGSVDDDTKHTYNQAFAVYALSSYYDASGDPQALSLASDIRKTIETLCRDIEGYLEAFTRDFKPAGNEKLSENGVEAERTMNTLLHVYEAYSEYLRVIKKALKAGEKDTEALKNTGIDLKKECATVADDLRFMLDVFSEKIFNPELKRQEVFFDRDYNSLIDLHSYGHDIEASWLVDRGLFILDDKEYTDRMSPVMQTLAGRIYERAYRDHSLLNECECGTDNTSRVWWVQAEAVLGFSNAAEKCRVKGDDTEAQKYLAAAEDIWGYIKDRVIDKRPGSEWFSQVDEDGIPISGFPIVEPWKCPYHNGRMCIFMQTG